MMALKEVEAPEISTGKDKDSDSENIPSRRHGCAAGFCVCSLAVTAIIVLFVLVLLSAPDGYCDDKDKPNLDRFDEEGLQRIRDWQQELVTERLFPFTQIYLSYKGKEQFYYESGFQDVETQKPVSRKTVSRIFSMSKPITSLALLMLVERGKLQLEDPIYKYLGNGWMKENMTVVSLDGEGNRVFSPCETDITISMLLTHTSGLSYGFTPEINPVDQMYVEEGIQNASYTDGLFPFDNIEAFTDALSNLPLASQPGKEWLYSYSTDVVGRVIEVASNMTLSEFLQEYIFEPLGMKATGFSVSEKDINEGNFAQLYIPLDGSLVPLPGPFQDSFLSDVSLFSGGGGLVSTIDDYAKFAEMIANGGRYKGTKIVSPKTIDVMISNQLFTFDEEKKEAREVSIQEIVSPYMVFLPGLTTGFGLAGLVSTKRSMVGGLPSPGTFGWSGAASTTFLVDPLEDLVIIFHTQLLPSGIAQVPELVELTSLVYGALN